MNFLKQVKERLRSWPLAPQSQADHETGPAVQSYEFEAHLEGEIVQIRLVGEVDYLSAGAVKGQLLPALDLGPGAVHFDLREISFMDVHGLSVMTAVAKRLRSENRPVTCITNQRMAAIFRMCDLTPLLNVTAK